MANSQPFLLLIVLLSVASAKPLDSQKVKRDSPTHHVVQLPAHSLVDDAETHPSSSSDIGMSHSQPTHSDEKVQLDNNDVPQSTLSKRKGMLKPSGQIKKRPAGERKSAKKGKKSNSQLLHHLGMTKLRSPTINHHRKRLASQSRKTHHQKSSSDSKMFVIKLPPNPYYYAHHDLNGFDVLEPQPKSVNSVPVNFKTNGKPSRVYHWNIPVIKKLVARKAGSSKTAVFADSDIFSIDKQATWNETDDDKSMYRKATFYGPKKQPKQTFRKYFAGNGKPHSFYVMGKSQKPASVHRLLP